MADPGPGNRMHSLLEPSSIAVVGASERPGPGKQVISNLEQLGYTGRIIPVNPNHHQLDTRRCFHSLTDAYEAGEPVELAVILLGRERVAAVLKEAGRLRIPAAWAFASGFSEAGEEGECLERELVQVCQEHSVAFCGPNCVGFLNPGSKLGAFSAPVSPSLQSGNVSAVVQSGSICLALANSSRGIGFRYLVSSGNEAVLDACDYIDFFLADKSTDVVLAFIEQIRRPDRFIDSAKRARTLRKPLIALKVGRSNMAKRATISHTGAVAGSDHVYDAVFRKYGVIRVNDLDEMLETAEAFSKLGKSLPGGPRVGMLTLSGGEIGLIGDLSEGSALEFPPWSDDARARFRSALPPYADIGNPLDAWGSGRVEETYAQCVDAAAEEDVDILVISQDAPTGMAPNQVEQYRAVAAAAGSARKRSGKPIAAISHLSGGLDEELRDCFAAGGIPLLQGSREGLSAIDHLITYKKGLARQEPTGRKMASRAGERWLESGRGTLDEVQSKKAFREYGIPCVEEEFCNTPEEAAAAASRLGYPVALKVVSPALPHKTEARALALNVADEISLHNSYSDLLKRAGETIAADKIAGILVQRMVEGAVAEVLIGTHQDETFGPVVLFAPGGVFVELFEDQAVGVLPLDHREAKEMIVNTKAGRLLSRFRGGKAGDVQALADAIVSIGQIAEDWKDRIRAIDINPLLVLPEGEGVLAIDGLIETYEI